MKLDRLFRDVNSMLGKAGARSLLAPKDVINAINDAIARVRVKYIKQGMGQEFGTTESLTNFTQDTTFPFLNSDALSNTLIRDVPIEFGIINGSVKRSNNDLLDQAQTYSAGDLAVRDGTEELYECVTGFSSTNTYNNVFKETHVRTYFPNNGLTYQKGDIVYSHKDGTYWKADSKYTNDDDTKVKNTGSFTQQYWRELGDGYGQAIPVEFNNLQTLQLADEVQFYPFSIKNKTVYSHDDLDKTITYIPEWTDVTDRTKDLDIPFSMVDRIKRLAVQLLAQKVNVDMDVIIKDEDE